MKEEKELVRLITEEVMRRLRAEKEGQDGKQKVLALFCGGLSGAKEAIASLKSCRDLCTTCAVLTPGAERVLGTDRIRSELSPEELLTDGDEQSEIELIGKADLLVIPVFTRNSAAKATYGIADNLVTRLLAQAFLQSKPVIAAREACDVSQKAGANPVYKSRLTANIRQLEQYGVLFTDAAYIGGAVKRNIRRSGTDISRGENFPSAADFAGKLLTRAEVSGWKGDVLRLPPGTVVTPAAMDAAGERGIELCRLTAASDFS
ncbi:flavoprotein [Caproiciproducens sp.]